MEYDLGTGTGFGNRRLRLSTITNTRWLAITGQLAAVTFVALVLRFELPIVACLFLIALAAILNMALSKLFPANKRLRPVGVFAVLIFDVAQLAGLLALTGGLTNPFCILLVVPVIISATTLPPRFTVILALITAAFASALAFVHLPLPWYPHRLIDIPLIFVAGMWVAVVSMMVFTALYAYRVAEEARRLSDALAATELVLQREQHISALDGMAAAAAHELGTPLATISLVAKEMAREPLDPDNLRDDIALLRTQADRCREILRRLSTLGAGEENHMTRLALRTMLEEVIAPHREFGITIAPTVERNAGTEPVCQRNPGILYGLGNLVENAVDFARERVEIRLAWDADTVRVRIIDDGPGFPPEVLEHLGEPDLKLSRAANRPRNGGGGLGLGIFIAKTLLERSGASVRFSNAFSAGKGADVVVEWPRSSMQAAA
ncbi:ActS/PrrB/RegB family redox-sensitive histidine kinase [Oricola sp.]|uniref:ActS/PrrB/RegB family redox-sensitive histidine kinase n=1 Tax=Oricola sp. TaxID=1979950 RepID=UPI0025D5C983|nr:ActS/PrrB/RegB family redox-sensitive histidine kinase [Oricola sp.]MCI5077925.1 ActS/PrrB/RegB family redox-sensitive histidine kinase [Oricola sp.]